MALLNDILAWTVKELTLCKRDPAGRLFRPPSGLTDKDYEELFLLLKTADGLPHPKNIRKKTKGNSNMALLF